MTEEKGKLTARKVRNFYLYPYRSKGENLARGSVWMASWLIGIIAQQIENEQALGGAYLIFALSLLLEFLPESKEYFLPKLVHSIFYILLLMMLLGSVLLSFWETSNEQVKESLPYQLLVTPLPYIGWIVFGIISMGTALALIEVHRYVYDEEAEMRCKMEAKDDRLNEFYNKLEGTAEGGNT